MKSFSSRWAAALLLAFVVPATSQAQLGGLGKKIKTTAKTAVKAVEDIKVTVETGEPATGQAAPATATSATATASTGSAIDGTKTSIYGSTWQIASYDHDTKQFTFTDKKYTEGELAGKPVTYTYDEASGEVHDADGTLKGTIGKDFVEVSGIGKVSILGEKGGLSLDGTTTIGRATTYDCTIYGTQMGSLSQNEPRELVAFFFLSECAADGRLLAMKKDFETRQQRQAASAAAFKEKLKNVTAGSFLDLAGNKLGSITADGKVLNKLGSQMGVVKVNGSNVEVYNSNNQRLGYISDTGIVYKGVGNEKVGQLNSTGRVEATSGATLGDINDNDFYDSKSNRQGSFSGKGVYVAAALRYFFFTF